LVIAPVIVLWATTPLRPFSRWSLLETATILILATAIGVTAFSPLVGSSIDVPANVSKLVWVFYFNASDVGRAVRQPTERRHGCVHFLRDCVWGLSIGSSPLPNADLNESLLLLFALSNQRFIVCSRVKRGHGHTP
jgi:hypothetical protein